MFLIFNFFHSLEAGNILCTGVEDDLLVKCVLETGAIEVDVNVSFKFVFDVFCSILSYILTI